MHKTPIMADPLPQIFIDALADQFEILPWDDSPNSPVLERAAGIVIYAHPAVDGPLMDRMPNLKIVSNHGVGVDHVDVAAADERNILVGNTPGCLDQSTADMTMALMLAIARNVVVGDHFARSPEFVHYDPKLLIGQEVSGSTLGIVGLGRIGKEVAKRAAGFDMPTLYHNRNRDLAAEKQLGVKYVSLDELLEQSDFVSLNCPMTAETHHLISTDELQKMKPSAFLINMARGPVVDTDALYEALTTDEIAGAGLDVTDPEPLPRDHRLLKLDNVIIAPHLGSASNRTRQRMMEITVENLIAGISGHQLPHRVTLKG